MTDSASSTSGSASGRRSTGETNLVRKWNPEIPTWYYDGETEAGLKVSFMWHAELLATRRLRDELDLRGGITFLPLLYLPMTPQPVMMAVWVF